MMLSFYQCNSQNNNLKTPISKREMPNIENPDYFVGSWFKTKVTADIGRKKIVQPQTICQKKSYWKFKKENGMLKHSRFSAKGKNCNDFASTNFGSVQLEGNQMRYVIDDVVYVVQIKIISTTEFILMTKYLIDGKMHDVEETYTKAK